MARLVGPSEASREVKTIVTTVGPTNGLFRAKAGRPATYYDDPNPAAEPTENMLTALADIRTLAGAVIAESTVTIDQYSMLPLMRFPDGDPVGPKSLLVQSDGGPPWRVYAQEHDRIDEVERAVPYDVRRSGVVGNGSTDDSAALAAAVAVCSGASKRTLYIPAELNVRIASQVNMQLVRRIDCQGTITVAYTGGPGLIVGDSSAQRNGAWYYFKRVAYAGAQSNVAMRVVGLKSARVEVTYCDYLQLYAEAAVSSQSSIAYTEFFLGRVPRLELYGATGASWINENNFYGGSIDNLIIDAVSYGHNGNTFNNCSIEGSSSTIQVLKGSANRIECRGEGAPSVTLGSGTWANQVVGTYISSAGGHATQLKLVADGGVENVLTSAIDQRMSYRELVKVDSQSVFFNGSSEWSAPETPVPGFDKLALRSSFGAILDTGIVPIRGAFALDGGTNYYRNWSVLRLNFDSDVALWRPQVFGYDAAGVLIDPTVTPWMQTVGGWTANSTNYSFGSNVQFAQIVISDPTVASIRVVVSSSSSAGTAFGWIRLLGYVAQPQPDTGVNQIIRALRRPLYQAAVPTQGLAKLGQVIGGPAGLFTCIGRADTTLAVAASTSDASVTVTSATGITNGDVIGILLDNGKTHWTTVNGAPSGAVVTLTAAMPSAAAIGKSVGTNRWLTVA